jgi:hypothetical protein
MYKFGYFPTSVYAGAWPQMRDKNPEWRIEQSATEPFFGTFQSPFLGIEMPLIVPGHNLSPEVRAKLAALPSPLFIKTHEIPFEEHFPGERFITIQRHPGAALWSYYHLLKEKGRNTSLELVIEGEVPHGSWSTYSQTWREFLSRRDAKDYIVIAYEDLKENLDLQVDRLSTFLDLPSLEQPLPTFEALQQQNPKSFRSGSSDAWSENLTQQQKQLLLERHAPAMCEAGYGGSGNLAFSEARRRK